jgi:excisionase family DNA binding protein
MDIDFSRPRFVLSEPKTWPELLTLDQTAQILGVSKWSLRRWDNEGKFKAVRMGSHRRYKKEDVIRATNKGI